MLSTNACRILLYIYKYIYTYMYIYICVCVCVCVYVKWHNTGDWGRHVVLSADACRVLLVSAYGSGVSPRHYQSGTRCVAVYCNVLQRVADCMICSSALTAAESLLSIINQVHAVLLWVVVSCSVHAVSCSELQWVAVSCSLCDVFVGANSSGVSGRHYPSSIRYVAVSCSELQWVAVSCSRSKMQ